MKSVFLHKACKASPCYQNISGLPCFTVDCSNENNRICLLSRTKGILTIMFTNTPIFKYTDYLYWIVLQQCLLTEVPLCSVPIFKIRLLSYSHTEHLFINKTEIACSDPRVINVIHLIIVFWLGLLVQNIHCKLPFYIEAWETSYLRERRILCTKKRALMSYCCLFFYNIIDWVQ